MPCQQEQDSFRTYNTKTNIVREKNCANAVTSAVQEILLVEQGFLVGCSRETRTMVIVVSAKETIFF